MIQLHINASAFEILWNITLALLLLRVSFFYFILTFLTGCIFGYLRVIYLIPFFNISSRTGELIEAPFMLFFTIFWAYILLERFEIPFIGCLRLVIGLTALGYMVITELVLSIIMYEEGWRKVVVNRDPIAGPAFAIILVLFGLM